MNTITILKCECHQPDGIAVYDNSEQLLDELTEAYDSEWAYSALECAYEIDAPDGFDRGNGYFGDYRELIAALIKSTEATEL